MNNPPGHICRGLQQTPNRPSVEVVTLGHTALSALLPGRLRGQEGRQSKAQIAESLPCCQHSLHLPALTSLASAWPLAPKTSQDESQGWEIREQDMREEMEHPGSWRTHLHDHDGHHGSRHGEHDGREQHDHSGPNAGLEEANGCQPTTARDENMCGSQQDRQTAPLPLICEELQQINKKKVTRQQRHGIPMRTTTGPVYLGSDAQPHPRRCASQIELSFSHHFSDTCCAEDRETNPTLSVWAAPFLEHNGVRPITRLKHSFPSRPTVSLIQCL